MKFITTAEAGEKWQLSPRRIGMLCNENRIPGAQKTGHSWLIPDDAEKPNDARIKTHKCTNFKATDVGLLDMTDLINLLQLKERVNIEVKTAANGLPNSIWETYSAFANTYGGSIVLGIAEDASTGKFIPKGISNTQQMLSDIWNTLNNRQKISSNILLDHHVYSIEHEGSDFIVIEVPRADRRDKPIFVGHDMFNGTFKRNHDGDYHCSAEEIKSMLRDQADTPQDALLLEGMEIGDLNRESIHRYRILFNNLKPSHTWVGLPNDEFLIKIGAAKKSPEDGMIHPTLGGLIFFGDFITITDELPNYFLDYREHLYGETRWSDRVCSGDGNWSGNIFDFYFMIIDRFTSDVMVPFRLDSNLQRIDDTPIHRSLRECLANALIHADYYGRRGIVIDKEFRKITIANPGTFRISIDEAIAGGISDARNGRIFNMFSLINVGERSGQGLCDVYSTWELNGFKRPKLIETVNPDRITLTLEMKDDDNGERRVINRVADYDIDLTENEAAVVSILREDSSLITSQVAEKSGLSISTVNRTYKRLKDKGYIARRNKTRGNWTVLK